MSIVQSRPETTRIGGATGKGFAPGFSGNPGGRPKGLGRCVRELVGEDGGGIADFMLEVMNNERARTADRIEAAKWLTDRGFGRGCTPLLPSALLSTQDRRRLRTATRLNVMCPHFGYMRPSQLLYDHGRVATPAHPRHDPKSRPPRICRKTFSKRGKDPTVEVAVAVYPRPSSTK